MTTPHDEPNLEDVMQPEESPRPSRREHAKAPPRPDEDELMLEPKRNSRKRPRSGRSVTSQQMKRGHALTDAGIKREEPSPSPS